MGVDDKAADMATIQRLRERLEAMSALKESLLASTKDLQEQVKKLKMELYNRDMERDGLLSELNYLREKIK